jgi:phage baseplate assembly protein W
VSEQSVPSFVGRGIAFPLRVDSTGSLAFSSGPPDIEKSMRVIIATAPGERPMRPEFGCGIWDLMFEPINTNTLGLMEESVREALTRWEPRAEITDVQVHVYDPTVGAVNIDVEYQIVSTNETRNLVYPFYMIPGEGDSPDELES